MTRPCFVVVDREYGGNISTRKLVIETAKINVISAYSAREALAALQRFPNVDGVVMDASSLGSHPENLIADLKKLRPSVPVVMVGMPAGGPSVVADYALPSFNPKQLLELLRELRPNESEAAQDRDQWLSEEAEFLLNLEVVVHTLDQGRALQQ
jgi:DNA-binding NtrC family response regulator